MRFAFCVEDKTDAAVFLVILKRLLGTDIEADPYEFRVGGWNQALRLAPKVARRAYQAGFAGALFAIDNDGRNEHIGGPSDVDECRLCLLRREAKIEEPLSWSRPSLAPLRYFFAVPTQTIETWLFLIREHPFSGAAEEIGSNRNPAGRRQLKRWLYDDDDPPRDRMLEVAIPLAERLVPDALTLRSRSFAAFAAQVNGLATAAATIVDASSNE